MGIFESVKSSLRLMFTLKGRARRRDVAVWYGFFIPIAATLAAVPMIVGPVETVPTAWVVLFGGLLLVHSVVSTTLLVRRLHDMNMRGWWALLVLIAGAFPLFWLFGLPLLLMCLFMGPANTANRFGPDPRLGPQDAGGGADGPVVVEGG